MIIIIQSVSNKAKKKGMEWNLPDLFYWVFFREKRREERREKLLMSIQIRGKSIDFERKREKI